MQLFLRRIGTAKNYTAVLAVLLVVFAVIYPSYWLNANPGAYTADDLLGQLDGSNNPVYTQGSADNGGAVSAKGFNKPFGAALDSAGHRLFVAEQNNNRVLVFNLNSSNQLADRVADNVLGQANFTSTSSGITVSTLNSPVDLLFDSQTSRLFVSDANNNRIMVFDVTAITDGENAVNVLGQSDFITSSSGTTASKMNNPSGMAYDSSGKRLFVVITSSHRVMVFDVTAITDGENAVNVLGQTDFTTATSGTTVAKLKLPDDAEYDATGNRLFVSDSQNNRVMVFDVAAITDGENAVNVLGQTDFTTGTAGTTQGKLSLPQGLSYDSNISYLYIGDKTNNRLMVFDVAAITDGENAVNVLGQTDFTTGASGTTQSTFNAPKHPALDATNKILWMPEETNNRVTIFYLIRITTSSLTNAEVNSAYSQTVATTESQGTVSFSVSSGSLSTGLSLNTSTGAITGTPTATGASTFTIQSTDTGDAGTFIDRKAYTLTVADTTAPTISSVASGSFSTSGATITWTTNEASSSQVEYGLTNVYGTSTTEADTSTRVTSHSVALTGLNAVTTYHYRVKSKDATGNQGVSADATFVTSAGGTSIISNPPPTAPTNIQTVYLAGPPPGITLLWSDPPSNATKVEVWRNDGGTTVITGPREVVALGVGKYSDKENIKPGTDYIYQLIAKGAGGQGLSNELKVMTIVESAKIVEPPIINEPELLPKLELTLTAAVVPSSLSAVAGPIEERTVSLAFALAFSTLLLGAFLIHTNAGASKGPLGFFAIFPLLFTSAQNSYMYLKQCGPEGCDNVGFKKHVALKHFSRASLATVILAGALKLLLVFVLTSVITTSERTISAQILTAQPGDQIVTTLVIKNMGTGKATNIVASIPTPVGLSFSPGLMINTFPSNLVPVSGVLSVSFVDLLPGASHTIKTAYKVGEPATVSGAVTFSASATSAQVALPAKSTGITVAITERPLSVTPVVPAMPPEIPAIPPVLPVASTSPVTASPVLPLVPQPQPQPLSEPILTPLVPIANPSVLPELPGQPEASAVLPISQVLPQSLTTVETPLARSNNVIAFFNNLFSRNNSAPLSPTIDFFFNASALASASEPANVAGAVPVNFEAHGEIPADTVLIEMVVQSDPQISPCSVSGVNWHCSFSTTLATGAHTAFVQAVDIHGQRNRIRNVVQFQLNLPACFDGKDNDNDGYMDFPDDPGCKDRADNDEFEQIAIAIAPVVSEQVKETVTKAVAQVQKTQIYQVLDKKVLNNAKVEKVNEQVATPVIIAAAAANTATAVVSTGVGFASLFTYLQGFLTQPFLLLTRRRRKEWGIVYSALTKMPVDLALVRIFSRQAGGRRLLQTRVTDKQGRYLLIASSGTYDMEVVKTGFTFPSAYLKDKSTDLDFTDLYHGGPFTVNASGTTIIRPIPLDPIEKTETPHAVVSRRRRRVVQKTVAYSGPLFAMVSVIISPTLTTGTLLLLQLGFLALFKRLAQGKIPHGGSIVTDARDGKPLPYAVCRIFDAQFNKLLEMQVTDAQGKYAFLAGRGSFYMTVEKPGYESYRSSVADMSAQGGNKLIKQDVRLKPSMAGSNPQSPAPVVAVAKESRLVTNGNGKKNGNSNGNGKH